MTNARIYDNIETYISLGRNEFELSTLARKGINMNAEQFRTQAREAIRGKWNSLALISFVYAVLTAALSFTGVGALIITGPISVAFAAISLRAIRGEHFEVKNLFDGFYNFLNTFLLGLLNTVFIFLWSLLFFVPGIIKSLSYSMSYYVMAENPDISPEDARQESIKMMDGNKMRLFCLNFSFIGWILLSILTFGILLFWVLPYIQAANAAFYEEIKPRVEIPELEINEEA